MSFRFVILNDSEESHSADAVISNESEKSHSAGIEILPPYSRQNDNAGKKKAASKRGPVILSEAKNLKNRFCKLLNGSPVNTPPPAAPGLLPCFRGAVRKD